MNNYIIIHGSFGSKDGNWFPWLKEQLDSPTRKDKQLDHFIVSDKIGVISRKVLDNDFDHKCCIVDIKEN